MRKLVVFMFLLLGAMLELNAQTYKYYSTDFAIKVKNDYGYWGEWSDWEPSKCLVVFSFDRRVITIYSEEPQEFDMYDMEEAVKDDSGESITLSCVDKNGLRCSTIFRRQDNGVLQLYVEYNDVKYVYCLEERN